MDLDPRTTWTLVVVALALAVLALVSAVITHRRPSRTQARYRLLWAGGEKDVIAAPAYARTGRGST